MAKASRRSRARAEAFARRLEAWERLNPETCAYHQRMASEVVRKLKERDRIIKEAKYGIHTKDEECE